jgi:hypothetical protein
MRAGAAPLAVLLAIAIFAANDLPPTTRVPPAPESAARGISYTNITVAAGLSAFHHVSGSPDKNYIIEVSGSGVGLFDYDGDGRLDVYLINGSTLDHVRAGTPAPRAALFRNEGGNKFTDVTAGAGVANERWGQGACIGDLDNDGDEDLYVTNFGPNRLYRNDGGTFADAGVKAGVAVDGWSTGCAFGDYDGDGWLDLFVAGYITLDPEKLPPPAVETASSGSTPPPAAPAAMQPERSEEAQAGRVGMGATYSASAPFCTYRGMRVMCGPRGLKGAPDHLFRNNRDGTFSDVSRESGVDDAKGLYGFGVAWVDLDDDGLLDLLVANDSGPNYVYRNTGNGRFEDVSYASGAALDGNGREQAHMGIAIADYDHDGRDDIHITNFADDFNVLYHNDGRLIFSDVSYQAGVAQTTIPFLGWGTDFLDYDNDTWPDLFVANGHVYPAADSAPWNTSYRQRALLFRNLAGKRFEEVGAAAGEALTTPHVARGSAVGDLDGDGGVDIVVNNIDGTPTVARNESSGGRGHWLRIRLVGDPAKKCPRDGIGSVVFVQAGTVRQRVEVASGRGQMSQSDIRPHVGLGTATKVDGIEVQWAGGAKATYQIDRVDTQVTIEQATGKVSYP